MPRRKGGTGDEDAALDVSVFMPLLVSDWLTGGATFVMNNRQRGAFLQMLAHAWKQQASLPNDLGALAKYADESAAWFDTPEGAAVLAQWPVGDDGRRRNPKQVEVYSDSLARRTKAHNAAITGAAARWGKRHRGDELPATDSAVIGLVPPDPAGPNLADAVAALPAVVAFAAASPDNTAALHRALMRVYDALGDDSLVGFAGEVNAALQGMHGPERTHDEVRRSLEDWCDNKAPINKNWLRAYFRGSRFTPGPNAAGRPLRPGRSAIATAGADAAWKLDA